MGPPWSHCSKKDHRDPFLSLEYDMDLEELNPGVSVGPQQDVESIERWAERNGISYGTARAWVYRGVLPSVKLGKLRMVNSALLRNWLLEQEWTA